MGVKIMWFMGERCICNKKYLFGSQGRRKQRILN